MAQSRQDADHAAREQEQKDKAAEAEKKQAQATADREAEMRPKIEAPEKTFSQIQLEREQLAMQEEIALRQAAETATANLPTPGGPVTGAMTGAAFAEQAGEGTVKMHFPRAFTYTGPGFTQVHFPAGIQEVPESVAEDPYVIRQGGKKV